MTTVVAIIAHTYVALTTYWDTNPYALVVSTNPYNKPIGWVLLALYPFPQEETEA